MLLVGPSLVSIGFGLDQQPIGLPHRPKLCCTVDVVLHLTWSHRRSRSIPLTEFFLDSEYLPAASSSLLASTLVAFMPKLSKIIPLLEEGC